VRTLPIVLTVFAAGCQNPDSERTSAEFTAPLTVKRRELVEVVADFKRGSNGELLSYRWSLDAQPSGSATSLQSTDTQATSFMTDGLGMYVVSLVVDDGSHESAPVAQTIEAKNVPPVARMAEVGHAADLGQAIMLDATGSTDEDGDPLTYRWYFDFLPEGSNAELSDPTIAQPTFVADIAGLYAPRVVASDGMDESEPIGVFVWAGTNEPPVAVAPADATVDVGQTFMLDASASHDPDPNDDLFTYQWTLVDRPAASQVALNADTQKIAELTPDAAGDYLVELVVKDELGVASAPDQVMITAR
jgi:hypothetical protein